MFKLLVRFFYNLSIKLHSVVCYNPMDVNRITDKNVRYDYLSEILWTLIGLGVITRNRMQFNADTYIYIFFKPSLSLKHHFLNSNFQL